jgi:type III secretory pathway component EscT
MGLLSPLTTRRGMLRTGAATALTAIFPVVIFLIILAEAVLALVHFAFFDQLFHALPALASDVALFLVIHSGKAAVTLIAVALITVALIIAVLVTTSLVCHIPILPVYE